MKEIIGMGALEIMTDSLSFTDEEILKKLLKGIY